MLAAADVRTRLMRYWPAAAASASSAAARRGTTVTGTGDSRTILFARLPRNTRATGPIVLEPTMSTAPLSAEHTASDLCWAGWGRQRQCSDRSQCARWSLRRDRHQQLDGEGSRCYGFVDRAGRDDDADIDAHVDRDAHRCSNGNFDRLAHERPACSRRDRQQALVQLRSSCFDVPGGAFENKDRLLDPAAIARPAPTQGGPHLAGEGDGYPARGGPRACP